MGLNSRIKAPSFLLSIAAISLLHLYSSQAATPRTLIATGERIGDGETKTMETV